MKHNNSIRVDNPDTQLWITDIENLPSCSKLQSQSKEKTSNTLSLNIFTVLSTSSHKYNLLTHKELIHYQHFNSDYDDYFYIYRLRRYNLRSELTTCGNGESRNENQDATSGSFGFS